MFHDDTDNFRTDPDWLDRETEMVTKLSFKEWIEEVNNGQIDLYHINLFIQRLVHEFYPTARPPNCTKEHLLRVQRNSNLFDALLKAHPVMPSEVGDVVIDNIIRDHARDEEVTPSRSVKYGFRPWTLNVPTSVGFEDTCYVVRTERNYRGNYMALPCISCSKLTSWKCRLHNIGICVQDEDSVDEGCCFDVHICHIIKASSVLVGLSGDREQEASELKRNYLIQGQQSRLLKKKWRKLQAADGTNKLAVEQRMNNVRNELIERATNMRAIVKTVKEGIERNKSLPMWFLPTFFEDNSSERIVDKSEADATFTPLPAGATLKPRPGRTKKRSGHVVLLGDSDGRLIAADRINIKDSLAPSLPIDSGDYALHAGSLETALQKETIHSSVEDNICQDNQDLAIEGATKRQRMNDANDLIADDNSGLSDKEKQEEQPNKRRHLYENWRNSMYESRKDPHHDASTSSRGCNIDRRRRSEDITGRRQNALEEDAAGEAYGSPCSASMSMIYSSSLSISAETPHEEGRQLFQSRVDKSEKSSFVQAIFPALRNFFSGSSSSSDKLA